MIAGNPGHQRQDFVREAAHEADHGAAAEQKKYEDIERRHVPAASLPLAERMPAP